jgi:hypothetical protein
MTAGPGLPEEISVPVQDRHYPIQVGHRLISPAKNGKYVRAAHQDAAGQYPARHKYRPVEMGHTPGGLAGQGHRQAEAGLDVGLALRLACHLGRAQGATQFGQPFPGMTEIPQRDSGGLMRDRCHHGRDRRLTRQQRTGLGQCLRGPGMHKNEKVISLSSIWGAIATL